MLVLPVIDLQAGIAVHGRAGERHVYRAVHSLLTTSPNPLELAIGIRDRLGLNELYVADLDAIAGGDVSWSIHQSLAESGMRLWIDAGVQRPEQAMDIHRCLGDAVDIVLGLETLDDVNTIRSCRSVIGAERIVVSLDMDDGQPRTRVAKWRGASALSIVGELHQLGVERLILLDIRRVGTGRGTGTNELLRSVRAMDPGLQITCGGGVRHESEMTQLAHLGCDAVLLATALHDGSIGRSQIASLR